MRDGQRSWVKAERACCAPDRKFTVFSKFTPVPMSSIRHKSASAALVLAAAGSAVTAAAVLPAGSAQAVTATSSAEASSTATAQTIARGMLPSYGWGSGQFPSLNSLWTRESSWNKYAENPYSGAYGIPQALPAGKMASAGPDLQSNATTQIRWGLGYIRSVYGTPVRAWGHELVYGWY